MNAPRLVHAIVPIALFALCFAPTGDSIPLYGNPDCPNCLGAQAQYAQGPAAPPGGTQEPPIQGPVAPVQPMQPAPGQGFAPPPSAELAPHPQYAYPPPPAGYPAAQGGIPYPQIVGPIVPPHIGPPPGIPLPGPALVAPHETVEEVADPPIPIVRIRVRAPACSTMGKELEYRIKIENCSQADAHHVTVKNVLPAHVKLVSASPVPHQKEPELQWHLGTLPAGGCHDIILVVVPQGTWDVKNCTRVQFEYGQCVTTKLVGTPAPEGGQGGPPEIFPGSKGPAVTPEIPPGQKGPRLWISMQGHKQQYVNMAAQYFISVANKGNATAKNVLVTAHLPKEGIFAGATDNGRHLKEQVAWFVGDIEPGQVKTVELGMKAKAMGKLCVQGTAIADDNLRVEDESCTNFQGVSALLMESVDRDDPIEVGGQTSYPILVRNTGSAPVTNLQIRAFVPAGLSLVRAKGPTDHQQGPGGPQGQWVVFKPLAFLEPDAKTAYEVFVKGEKAGDARFHVEMFADQLDNNRPVIEEESTLVVQPDELPRIRPLSRRKKSADDSSPE